MMTVRPLRLSLLLSLLTLVSCTTAGAERNAGAGIDRIWSVDVDQRQPNDPSAYSQAAFSASTARIVVGGRDARIHIYDLDGHEQATISIDSPSDSGALALANGLVIVGDVSGKLFAVDAAAGRIAWQYQLSAPFMSLPVAVDDGVVVQTLDDHIYCFSGNGEKRWSHAGSGNGLNLYITAPPLLHGRTLFAMFANGDAAALKVENGDLIWSRQLLLNNDAAVLTELRAPVAQPLYMQHVGIGMEKADSALLVSFYQGEIVALSAADGRQLFSIEESLKSAPLLDDGVLYIADANGYLAAIDPGNGATLWKKKIGKGELIGPVSYNDMLWLADDQGGVFRIGKDGNNQASVELGGRIERELVVTPDGVLVRTGRGQLSLLR